MAAARGKAASKRVATRQDEETSSLHEEDSGRLDSQSILQYADEVAKLSNSKAFVQDFGARVATDRNELLELINEQTEDDATLHDQEVLDLVKQLQTSRVAISGDISIVRLATMAVQECSDLIQFYHDAEKSTTSMPNVESSDAEDDHESIEFVQKLLGHGKQKVFMQLQRELGVPDDVMEAEGAIDKADVEIVRAVFHNSVFTTSPTAVLKDAEKGIKRMLRSLPYE